MNHDAEDTIIALLQKIAASTERIADALSAEHDGLDPEVLKTTRPVPAPGAEPDACVPRGRRRAGKTEPATVVTPALDGATTTHPASVK